jgi:hypothetical protein
VQIALESFFDALTASHEEAISAAVAAERIAINTRLVTLLDTAQQAHEAGDLATIGAVLVDARIYTIEAQEAAKEKLRTELQAQLAALA